MAKYINVVDTAKLVRAALKEAFPAVKFRVTSSSYAGGASINVRYVNGPTQNQVEQVVKVFEGSYFDGMQDYKGSNYANLDGEEVKFGADYVFVNRKYTSDFLTGVIVQVCNEYKFDNEVTVYVSNYDQAASISNVAANADSLSRGFAPYDINRIIQNKVAETSLCNPLPSKTAARVYSMGDDGYGYGCVGRLAA
jgi:hypothetical protein